jgi:FAD/FMN-containing dehydrogenase
VRSVIVDKERQIAHVQGGAKLADFDAECNAQGLCTVAGSDPRTGLGGYVAGGGWGWLSRKYGMSIDSLLEAECVLADGSVVIANEKENSDLFWALRGAGASFAVIARYTMKLYPLPKCVIAGMMLYPEEKGKECLKAVRDHILKAPRDVATMWELNWGPPNKETGVRWVALNS